MSRYTMTVARPVALLASASLAGAMLAGALLVGSGVASAQTAPRGQFGQRTGGGNYVPSTSDPGCVGIICNPLPSVNPAGGVASNPSEVLPPPPCQGLLCGLTPYSMQRPYTAADAAAAEKARAAAQAQAAVQQGEPMAPTRRGRKLRKKVAKTARTPVPVESDASR